ncbi:MAG: hypothetical protein ACLS9B_05370 [Coprococcus comes]
MRRFRKKNGQTASDRRGKPHRMDSGRRMSSYYQVGDQTKKILKIKIMEE